MGVSVSVQNGLLVFVLQIKTRQLNHVVQNTSQPNMCNAAMRDSISSMKLIGGRSGLLECWLFVELRDGEGLNTLYRNYLKRKLDAPGSRYNYK